MQVQEIKKMKSGKYKIKIDDRVITTYDDVLIENNLLTKKEIDYDLYNKLEMDSTYYNAYYRAVNHITKKMRSESEIKEYLEKLDVDNNSIDNIIYKLKTVGLLNDNVYIKAYILDAFNLSSDGPNKIKSKLLSQNLDESVIDEYISEIKEDEVQEKLGKLVAKKINRDKKTSAYKLKQKIMTDMINLGFDKDMVLDILNDYELNDTNKLKQEYDKLYKKYSNKLEGRELYKKISEKLYNKSFDINEIQAHINEYIGE